LVFPPNNNADILPFILNQEDSPREYLGPVKKADSDISLGFRGYSSGLRTGNTAWAKVLELVFREMGEGDLGEPSGGTPCCGTQTDPSSTYRWRNKGTLH
jgi:hypothetical protein